MHMPAFEPLDEEMGASPHRRIFRQIEEYFGVIILDGQDGDGMLHLWRTLVEEGYFPSIGQTKRSSVATIDGLIAESAYPTVALAKVAIALAVKVKKKKMAPVIPIGG